MKSWIQTFTRQKFSVLEPDLVLLDVRDIARGLSMQCRYVGQVGKFYSVAEHCIRVSRKAEEMLVIHAGHPEQSEEVQVTAGWGLIHDAAEAYLGDVPAPVKRLPEMAAYRDAERRVMATICEWLSLPKEEPRMIEFLDKDILGLEVSQLKSPPQAGWDLSAPWPGSHVLGWAPKVAEALFLARFERIFGPVEHFYAKVPA